MPQLDSIFYLYIFLTSLLGFIFFQIIFIVYIINDYFSILRMRYLIRLDLNLLKCDIIYYLRYIKLKNTFKYIKK